MNDVNPYAGRRVLVTGGTGFLGLNLVGALRAAGSEVRTLSRGGGGPTTSAVTCASEPWSRRPSPARV